MSKFVTRSSIRAHILFPALLLLLPLPVLLFVGMILQVCRFSVSLHGIAHDKAVARLSLRLHWLQVGLGGL